MHAFNCFSAEICMFYPFQLCVHLCDCGSFGHNANSEFRSAKKLHGNYILNLQLCLPSHFHKDSSISLGVTKNVVSQHVHDMSQENTNTFRARTFKNDHTQC